MRPNVDCFKSTSALKPTSRRAVPESVKRKEAGRERKEKRWVSFTLRRRLTTNRNFNLDVGGYGSPLRLPTCTMVARGTTQLGWGKLGAASGLCVPITQQERT